MQDMLLKWIDDTEEKIFACQFNEAGQEMLSGIELLARAASSLPAARLEKFNGVMTEMMAALQNYDYLLLADLLEYKCKPFLQYGADGGRQ